MKNIAEMTVVELRAFLAARNLPTTGNKPDLLLRVEQATAVIAEQPSSTSTPLKIDRDVNALHDVTSDSKDDAILQDNPKEQGELHDAATTASAEEHGELHDAAATASGHDLSYKLPANPAPADHGVGKHAFDAHLQSYEIQRKRQALDDFLKLEEMKEAGLD